MTVELDAPTLCQSQRDGTCNNVAQFQYNSPKGGSLLLCINHAYSLMNDVGKQFFEPLTIKRYTLHCRDCGMTVRIEKIGIEVFGQKRTLLTEQDDELMTIRTPFAHCPSCGSMRVMCDFDAQTDYWELLAQSFNMPKPLVKLLHDGWLRDGAEQTFKQFVKEIRDASAIIIDSK